MMNLRNVTYLEFVAVLMILAIVASFFLTVFGSVGHAFKEECHKVGGAAVWDGRQYQCFRSQHDACENATAAIKP